MRRHYLIGAVAAVVLIIGIAFIIYEDIRLPWQKQTFFEKEFPGCASGIISKDYSALKLPTAFRHFYLAWGDNFPAEEMDKSARNSAILALTWEPHLKKNPEHSILNDIASGKHDAYMTAMAAAIKKYGHPIMLRWGHEPNGDWYAWSGAKNERKPKIYIKAWRRMAAIIRTEAGPRVKLIFSVNGEDRPNEKWNRFENYYPGSEYADAIGLDIYNWGNSQKWSSWRKPHIILKNPYRRALDMAPDKPLFLTEVASCPDGGSKDAWLIKLLQKIKKRYTAVKGFMWFDYDKECDWRVSSNQALADIYGRKAAAGYFEAEGKRLNWLFGE